MKLERTTTIKGETKTTVAYAITSHTPESANAEQLLTLWRDRWAIENRLFWVKDAVLREDHSRIRTGNAAFAMSLLRNAIINYFRAYGEPSIAAAFRYNVLHIQPLLAKLGIFIQ